MNRTKNFIKSTYISLINPKKYFAEIQDNGRLSESIIRICIYGLINSVLNASKALLVLPTLTFPINKIINPDIAVGLSFINSFIITVAAFLTGGIFIFFLAILCKGDKKLELSFRISSLIAILIPINSLLQFVNLYYPLIGKLFSIITFSYAIWMLYNALLGSLKADRKKVIISSIILFLFIITIYGKGIINRKIPEQKKGSEKIKNGNKIQQLQKLFNDRNIIQGDQNRER